MTFEARTMGISTKTRCCQKMTRKVVLDQFHLSKWKTTFTLNDNENTVMILFIDEKKVSVRENC